MTTPDWNLFADKVRIATETSLQEHPERGTVGLELEFNILDEQLKPVSWVGSGPERQSFADYLHEQKLPQWVRERFQLEVFHWMTEAASRPYYSATALVAEARVLEGVLYNVLAEIGAAYGERFFALHGNIPGPVTPTADSIPGGWNLARKRYLARCVELYGRCLATAGIHTNHSFPEALLSWDYFHLSPSSRRDSSLEQYRNDAVIRATRLLRPFCPVFIAVAAASPLSWVELEGRPEIVLSSLDSQRLLTFPNPASLDVPSLYRNHSDYLRISTELVRSGVRFGGNNWTPIRARSDVEPVSRNILATSSQLERLYREGIYVLGEMGTLEEAEKALTVENLCARVDLPMNRLEVRTDEGGDSFDLAVAKVVLKDLLMLRIYAESDYGSGFLYGEVDLRRARQNEDSAARAGLSAVIEHPFGGHECTVRQLLAQALDEVAPLAEALGHTDLLEPLVEMAGGGDNPAGTMRQWYRGRLKGGRTTPDGELIVPPELVVEWLDERGRELQADVRRVAAERPPEGTEASKLRPLLEGLRELSSDRPGLPVRLDRPAAPEAVSAIQGEVGEVLELAAALIRRPTVTVGGGENPEEVARCVRYLAGLLQEAGAEVRVFDCGRFPALLAGFPGALTAPVTLGGHVDVVASEPGLDQFEPRVDGDYLWGRGAADMKTVVASNIIWMRRRIRAGPPYPGFNLLLVGNEETGETERWGTAHVLTEMRERHAWQQELMILGERTGERGDETVGQVCTENRGLLRLRIRAHGRRGHSGLSGVPQSLLARLIEVRAALSSLFGVHLTLASHDGWESSARFPFLNVGEDGVYNITAEEGCLGLEVRPIPDDDLSGLVAAIRDLATEAGVEVELEAMDAGVICPSNNIHLGRLLSAVESATGEPAQVGRKLAGTSARFAPGGNAVVWGQTGLGVHSRDERHFIPSIAPYLNILDAFADGTEPG